MTETKKPERRRLASMISVRFSPDEVDAIRAHARLTGETMSGFLRRITLELTSPPDLPTPIPTSYEWDRMPSAARLSLAIEGLADADAAQARRAERGGRT